MPTSPVIGLSVGVALLFVVAAVFVALYVVRINQDNAANGPNCPNCPDCPASSTCANGGTCCDTGSTCCTQGKTCQDPPPSPQTMSCQMGQGAQLLTGSVGPFSYYGSGSWTVYGDGAINDTKNWNYSCPAGMLFRQDTLNKRVWCSKPTNCTTPLTEAACTAPNVNSVLCEWLPAPSQSRVRRRS